MSDQCAFAWGITKCSCHGRVPGHRVLADGERHEADVIEQLVDQTDASPMTAQAIFWAMKDQFELIPRKEG